MKKAAAERRNLISLTKLIVEDLISSSLNASRTIDEDQNLVHLSNYFTLLDRVLKHGLKQNFLSARSANLWTALDSLPKYLKDATLMSESVRSLANTKSSDGRIRAWLRLAMMQKRLPEYFSELLAHKAELLADVYYDYAFMLNDEAHVFAGLIIGVNVIDCNFFVKDANFDAMDEVIELAPYLRPANGAEQQEQQEPVPPVVTPTSGQTLENLTVVLDQKNYLEERSKRLESTISDLQARIRALEDQNSRLDMEAKVSEARLQKLLASGARQHETQEQSSDRGAAGVITGALRSLIIRDAESQESAKARAQQHQQQTSPTVTPDNSTECPTKEANPELGPDSVQTGNGETDVQSVASSEVASQQQLNEFQRQQLLELEKELANLKERTSILETSYRSALDKIRTLERDLDVQTSMNADKETTIQILEKDVREKQNQVEALRNSLNDSKKLNSDLSERLNDTTNKLKDRVKSLSSMQASLDKWKIENKTLAARLLDKQTALKSMGVELEKAKNTVEELRRRNDRINEDLKRERESGQSSSVTLESQNVKIDQLRGRVSELERELKTLAPFREQKLDLERRCQEYELSLEEIGGQLRESRLEVESLKENSSVFLDSQWMDSKQVKACALCQQSFSVTRRKHHCRLCGNVFCQSCSDNKMELASSAKPVRVCDNCHAFLLAKYVKSSPNQ